VDEQAIARTLVEGRDPRHPPVAAPPLADLEEAYRVQAAVVALLGDSVAGYKIACTSPIAQRHLGLSEPFVGRLLGKRIHASPARLAAAQQRFFVAEPEYAFTMGRDLPARDTPYGEEEVADAVESLHPAFELVGSAYGAAWQEVGAAALIADNAVHVALVLGPGRRNWRDLDCVHATVALSIDGSAHSSGTGVQALGGPVRALAWLAGHLGRRGEGLRSGQVITTGVVTEVAALGTGQTALADFGQLGSVEVSLF